jgi:cobalt-zinc-cadmium resistance protein CzcA
VGTVTKALGEAIVLVLVLLLLFLGNLRAALVVALILPLSALATFVLMRQWGLSANLMSLGGLAIAIGMLVDAAVVVVENIEARPPNRARRACTSSTAPPGGGHARQRGHGHHHDRVSAAADPAGAGGQAVRAGGADHRVCAGRVAAALAHGDPGAGLAAAAPGPPRQPLAGAQARRPAMRPCWTRPWRHPRTVALARLLALAGALALFPFIGKSFMPSLDEGDIIMQVEKLPSISLVQSSATDLALAASASSRPCPRSSASWRAWARTSWAWTPWA